MQSLSICVHIVAHRPVQLSPEAVEYLRSGRYERVEVKFLLLAEDFAIPHFTAELFFGIAFRG